MPSAPAFNRISADEQYVEIKYKIVAIPKYKSISAKHVLNNELFVFHGIIHFYPKIFLIQYLAVLNMPFNFILVISIRHKTTNLENMLSPKRAYVL